MYSVASALDFTEYRLSASVGHTTQASEKAAPHRMWGAAFYVAFRLILIRKDLQLLRAFLREDYIAVFLYYSLDGLHAAIGHRQVYVAFGGGKYAQFHHELLLPC